MTTNIAPAPVFSFTTSTLKSFEDKMEKLGFPYSGTFGNNIWIYRSNKTKSIDIQVGGGGVLYVSVIESDYTGRVVKNTTLDLSKVNTAVKLFNLIKKSI